MRQEPLPGLLTPVPSSPVYVGLDWGTVRHFVLAADATGRTLWRGWIAHSRAGQDALRERLVVVSGDLGRVRVGLETSAHSFADSLMMAGCDVYAINPLRAQRLRDRWTQAKSDSRDAWLLADALRKDPHLWRRLTLEPERFAELRVALSRYRQAQMLFRLESNRLVSVLVNWRPGLVRACPGGGKRWLWLVVMEPAALSVERAGALLATLGARSVTPDTMAEASAAAALELGPGRGPALREHAVELVERLRLYHGQVGATRRIVAERLAACGDPLVPILLSFPGIGPSVAAALLVDAGDALRQGDYPRLRALAGVAPVRKESGQSGHDERRLIRSSRLQRAIGIWVLAAIRQVPAYRAQYAALRHRGATGGRAARGVGDRLLRVLCSMARHGEPWRDLDATRRVADPKKSA